MICVLYEGVYKKEGKKLFLTPLIFDTLSDGMSHFKIKVKIILFNMEVNWGV